MLLLGQVMALTDCGPQAYSHSHKPKGRERNTTVFYHHGHRICRNTFLFLHGVSKHRLLALRGSYLSEGLVPRVHGNTGRAPAHALVMGDVRNIITFVAQYAEANAILLPGRVPGYKRDDIEILPSSTTKKSIWLLYRETAPTVGQRCVAYTTFCLVWRRFLQHIVVARPMTDLCFTCQKNNTAVVRSKNLSENEKSEVNMFITCT